MNHTEMVKRDHTEVMGKDHTEVERETPTGERNPLLASFTSTPI